MRIYIYDPGPRARGPPLAPPMVYPLPWDGRGGHGEGGLDEGRCGGLDEQMSRKAEEQKSRGAAKLVGVFQFEDRLFVAFVCFSEGSTLDSLAPAQSKCSHHFRDGIEQCQFSPEFQEYSERLRFHIRVKL